MTWFDEAKEILQIVHEEVQLMCWKEIAVILILIAAFGAACFAGGYAYKNIQILHQ